MSFSGKAVALFGHFKGAMAHKSKQSNQSILQGADRPQGGFAIAVTAGKMVREAYQLTTKEAEKGKVTHPQPAPMIGERWEVLCRSSDNDDTRQYGYKAVAFINRATKQIQIATAGTKPTEKHDLWDNCKLLFGSSPMFKPFVNCVPNKLRSSQKFVDAVIATAGGDQGVAGYTFSTCGHSLGAVMADINAAEILSRGLTFSSSTTFENPGSRTVVERFLADKGLKKEESAAAIKQLSDHCTEYNTWRGHINSFGRRLAGDVKLVVPSPAVERAMSWPTGAKFSYIGKQIDRVANFCGVFDILSQLKEHRLGNFSKLDYGNCYSVKNWDDKKSSLHCRHLPGSPELDSSITAQPVTDEKTSDWSFLTRPEEFTMDDAHPVGANPLVKLSHLVGAMAYFQMQCVYAASVCIAAKCLESNHARSVTQPAVEYALFDTGQTLFPTVAQVTG